MNKIFNKRDLFVLIVEVATIIFGFFYIQFGAGGDKDNVAPTQQPIIFVSDQNRASAAAKHLVTTTSRLVEMLPCILMFMVMVRLSIMLIKT